MKKNNTMQDAVTVIVPHYRQETQLAECLSCLEKQDYTGRITILVIDNDTSFSLDGWQVRFPFAQFLWEPSPGSYSARNMGIAHAQDAFLAFTDADCRPSPSWLRCGLEALQAQPDGGLVGGRITVTPHTGKAPASASEAYSMACEFRQDFYVRILRFAATANMFTTRDMFGRVGAFNAALRSSGDLEWGNRAYAAGYPIVYCNEASVEHTARNHNELKQKMLRLACGRRDLAPGWPAALSFALARLLPSPNQLYWIARSPDLSWKQKLEAALYHYALRLRLVYYRLQVTWESTPSQR